MKQKLSVFAALAISASPIFSQEVISLEEISFEADLDDIQIDETGAQIDLVSDEEVTNASVSQAGQVLDQRSGVNLRTTGGAGGISYISIRGANQNYIGVEQDGINVTEVSSPQSSYSFGNLSSADVGSIEIAKGSQGAIHGANAVGGLVSLSSPKPTENGWSTRSHFEIGSYGSYLAGVGFGYKTDQTTAYLNLSAQRTDGYSAGDDRNPYVDSDDVVNPEEDRFEARRLSLGIAHQVNSQFAIDFSLIAEKAEAEYDEIGYDADGFTIGVDGSTDEVSTTEMLGFQIAGTYSFGNTDMTLSYEKLNTKRGFVASSEGFSGVSYTDSLFEGKRDELTLQFDTEFSDQVSLSYGASWVKESAESSGISFGSTLSDEGEIEKTSLFASLNYSPIDNFDVSASIRYDDSDLYGDFTSYRIAGAYRPIDNLVLKASYGTGYRDPSVYENTSVYNVAPLERETSESFDISAKYGTVDRYIQLAYFSITTDNFIDFDFGIANADAPYGFGAYINSEGETKRSGFELETAYAITDRISIYGNLTKLETENPDGDQLALQPELSGTIGVNADITNALSLNVNANFAKDIVQDIYNNSSRTTERVELEDYTVYNAQVSYDLGDGEIYARVENLLDTEYQVNYGYGTSDRAYYVGYRTQF